MARVGWKERFPRFKDASLAATPLASRLLVSFRSPDPMHPRSRTRRVIRRPESTITATTPPSIWREFGIFVAVLIFTLAAIAVAYVGH